MNRVYAFWLAVAVTLALSSPAYSAGPKITLSPETWDMGTIYQWANPSTTVTITNTGDADLKILDVKASCGCTAAALSDKLIKPGGKATMKVDFNAYNSTGRVRKVVKLTTNDPGSPDKVLNIQGTVKDDKAAIGYLEQKELDLGVVAPYETKYFDLKVSNKGNIDLRLKTVELPAGYFMDSSFSDVVPARGDVFLNIGYRPAKSRGPIADEIEVKLSEPRPDQDGLKLKVVGYVAESVRGTDALIVTPTSFRVDPGSRDPVLELAVKNDGTGPVVLDGVESSLDGSGPDNPGAEVAPGESGKVRFSLKPEGLKPGSKGFIYLRLAVPVVVEGAGNK